MAATNRIQPSIAQDNQLMSMATRMQKRAEQFVAALRRGARADRPGDRRPRRHRPWRPDLPVRRRALPARRRAGPGQDAAGAHAGRGARPRLHPHPVHARPDAGRHHRHEHGHGDRPTASGSSSFSAGPIFAQICLADEINRATPKTQSALLEAMQEGSVTVGGKVHQLEAAVLRDGDAEPDRAGRHVSAARGPARSLLLQAGRRLLEPRGAGARSSTARRAARRSSPTR